MGRYDFIIGELAVAILIEVVDDPAAWFIGCIWSFNNSSVGRLAVFDCTFCNSCLAGVWLTGLRIYWVELNRGCTVCTLLNNWGEGLAVSTVFNCSFSNSWLISISLTSFWIHWVELDRSGAVLALRYNRSVSLAVLAVLNFCFTWSSVNDIALFITNLWGHLDDHTIVSIVTTRFNLRTEAVFTVLAILHLAFCNRGLGRVWLFSFWVNRVELDGGFAVFTFFEDWGEGLTILAILDGSFCYGWLRSISLTCFRVDWVELNRGCTVCALLNNWCIGLTVLTVFPIFTVADKLG